MVGERSREAASALRDFLCEVDQSLKPWMSPDIKAGGRWSREIEQSLRNSKFGISCVTRDNVNQPWLHFEAGAMSNAFNGVCVCPYLIDLKEAEVPDRPLSKFQMKQATKDGTWGLVKSLNSAPGGSNVEEGRLTTRFDTQWPRLSDALNRLPVVGPSAPRPTNDEKIDEILLTLRSLKRSESVEENLKSSWRNTARSRPT